LAATSDNDWRKSDQLVHEIIRLVEAGSTGTLFVRTADDHLGCVVFASGEIVSVMFRGVRGMQGIEYVRAFNQSTFRFDENALLWEDPGDLPDTREILRKLSESSAEPPLEPPLSESSAEPPLEPPLSEWSTQPLPLPSLSEPNAQRPLEPSVRTAAAQPPPEPSFSVPTLQPPPQPSFSRPAPRAPARFGGPKAQPLAQTSIALSATELKRTVCEAAMGIMGPLGRIICEEEFARAGILRGVDDLERLLRRVAAEIDDATEARDFCNAVLTKATPREGATTGPRVGVREGTPEYRQLREVIESEAVEFLGPLAAFLCDEYFRKFSTNNRRVDIGQVLNSLVDEIGDLQRAQEFRERIAQRLG